MRPIALVKNASVRHIGLGALTLFLLSAAANMASPLYPTYQQLYGMSDLMMTLLYATFAATALPALLLFGSAADTLGRRAVLVAGMVFAAFGTVLFAVDLAGIAGLFLGRVLLGVGLGLGTGAGIALMVEASPLHRPALGSTTATIAFVSGTGAGPIMAGIVAEHSSARTTTPFIVMLLALGVGTVLLAMLRTRRPVVRQRWKPMWPTVPAPLRSTYGVSAMTGFLGWSAIGVFLALLPSVAESVLTEPSLTVSGTVAGTVLIVSALSQLWAPRLNPRAAQTIGLSGLAIGTALLVSSYLPIFAVSGSLTMMAAAAIATGVGHGISYWGANQESDALTPVKNRAGVTAALYLAFYAGAGLPAVGVGVLSLNTSLTGAIAIISMILMLTILAFLPVPSLIQTQVFRAGHAATTPLPHAGAATFTSRSAPGSAWQACATGPSQTRVSRAGDRSMKAGVGE